MEILVIGKENSLNECKQKFGDQHVYRIAKSHSEAEKILKSESIVFDFKISEDTNKIRLYKNFGGIAFFELSKNSLEQLINSIETRATFFGFCGMPTFFNREILEISLSQKTDLKKLEEVCAKLNTKFSVVKDQPGLITPRVICMIINEAYFTWEAGTSTKEEIDIAMKLGTGYPFGPFEWAGLIGEERVANLLRRLCEENPLYELAQTLNAER